MTPDEFEQQRATDGFSESRTITYELNQSPDLHTHDFDAFVMVTEGQLTIGYEDRSETFGPGDSCLVPAGMLHTEQTGDITTSALLATR